MNPWILDALTIRPVLIHKYCAVISPLWSSLYLESALTSTSDRRWLCLFTAHGVQRQIEMFKLYFLIWGICAGIRTLSPSHTAKQDSIYVFPEMKLRCLVPNFHIHVSVNDWEIGNISGTICFGFSVQCVCRATSERWEISTHGFDDVKKTEGEILMHAWAPLRERRNYVNVTSCCM